MRGAEIWHIWKQHHLIACFWKILKSICQIRSMQLQGDGLYTSLLIKLLTSLLALRMKARREFSQSTITQIMRNLSRHHDLRDFMTAHFRLFSRDCQSSEQFAGLNRRYDEMQAEFALVPLTISETSQEEAL